MFLNMASQNAWLSSVLLEHACKEEFDGVLKRIFKEKSDFQNFTENEVATSPKTSVQPIFLLSYLLKKFSAKIDLASESNYESFKNFDKMVELMIDLLETTYKQLNFTSLKKFLTFSSELKLLDLLGVIFLKCESTLAVQKMNFYFPRWTDEYRKDMKNNFSIDNEKTLSKVEESHAQSRKLILKLCVDKNFQSKYKAEQYRADMKRITLELKAHLKDIINALDSYAGCSVLEKLVSNTSKAMAICDSDDLSFQLLLDYVQTGITSENLLKYLEDFGGNDALETSNISACLNPFDSMSEGEEENTQESDCSQSEYECTQDTISNSAVP